MTLIEAAARMNATSAAAWDATEAYDENPTAETAAEIEAACAAHREAGDQWAAIFALEVSADRQSKIAA